MVHAAVLLKALWGGNQPPCIATTCTPDGTRMSCGDDSPMEPEGNAVAELEVVLRALLRPDIDTFKVQSQYFTVFHSLTLTQLLNISATHPSLTH